MQTSPGFICDQKSRCKHCLGYPEYITNLQGLIYHSPAQWNKSNARGSHRGMINKNYHRLKDDIEYDYNHLIRWNSIPGVASISSYKLKNHKNEWGNYRQVITCKCGLSSWMYPGPTTSKNFLNRKKHITASHYKRRYSLEGMINSTGYTW